MHSTLPSQVIPYNVMTLKLSNLPSSGQRTTQFTGKCTEWICTQSTGAALVGFRRVKREVVCTVSNCISSACIR